MVREGLTEQRPKRREQATQTAGRRVFQAERTGNPKAHGTNTLNMFWDGNEAKGTREK